MIKMLIVVVSLALTSCGVGDKYPEAFGTYLVDDSGAGSTKYRALRDIDAITNIEIDLTSKPTILVFDRVVAGNPESLRVYAGIYVRNFRKNDNWKGNLPVRALNSWGLYEQKLVAMPGQLLPVKGQPEMVVWRPSLEMKPGVYYVRLGGSLTSAPRTMEPFFYKRSVVTSDLLNSDLCYDYFQFYMAPEDRFFPCRQNFADGTAPKASATPQLDGRDADKPVDRQLIAALETRPINIDTVKAQLAVGASPNANDEYNAISALGNAVQEDRVDVAALLISKGANVNAMSSGDPSRPELFRARSERMIQLLLDNGADINGKSSDGRNALHYQWNPKLVAYLLAKGCDPNTRGNDGKTPLGIALGQQNHDDEALAKGAEVFGGVARVQQNRAVVELLTRNGAAL